MCLSVSTSNLQHFFSFCFNDLFCTTFIYYKSFYMDLNAGESPRPSTKVDACRIDALISD